MRAAHSLFATRSVAAEEMKARCSWSLGWRSSPTAYTPRPRRYARAASPASLRWRRGSAIRCGATASSTMSRATVRSPRHDEARANTSEWVRHDENIIRSIRVVGDEIIRRRFEENTPAVARDSPGGAAEVSLGTHEGQAGDGGPRLLQIMDEDVLHRVVIERNQIVRRR